MQYNIEIFNMQINLEISSLKKELTSIFLLKYFLFWHRIHKRL